MTLHAPPENALTKFPDWAGLRGELLALILENLSLSDCVRLGAVCKQWRSILLENPRTVQSRAGIPLLLVPSATDRRRSVYCVIHRKIVETSLPAPSDGRLVGSSHGWVAAVDNVSSAVILMNPFTGASIPLPPIFQDPPPRTEYFIKKIILQPQPHPIQSTNSGNFKVIALHDVPYRSMAVIRAGEESWTHVAIDHKGPHVANLNEKLTFLSQLFVLCDVIHYKGKIYVVDTWSRLILIDFDSESQIQTKIVVSETTLRRHYTYLVESSGGDLLMVHRFLQHKPDGPGVKTLHFKVFKLISEGIAGWAEIEGLGGDTLFLGVNDSMAVAAALVPGCQANCIYFTDDYIDFSPPFDPKGSDMGVFNLGDGSTSEHCFPNSSEQSLPMPPVWISPTMRGI